MPIVDATDLPRLIDSRQRLLGLDVGAKTIGLAIADSGFQIASPLETIRRTRFRDDLEQLRKIIDARGIGALVVGLPVNMDGSEGPRCQSVRQFAANLLDEIDLPLAFWDERLSTAAVDRTMIAADVTRRKRAKAVDKLAAAFILQGALDRIRNAKD